MIRQGAAVINVVVMAVNVVAKDKKKVKT